MPRRSSRLSIDRARKQQLALTGGAFVLFVAAMLMARASPAPGDEALGRRLFLKGITAAGEPVRAQLHGDVPLTGDAAACARCHGGAGQGTWEGTIETPPLLARVLFSPREGGNRDRPEYSERTLLTAITRGRSVSGRELGSAMPRFDLDPADRANLFAWLRSLGNRPSPGVGTRTVRVGAALPLSGPLKEAGEDARAVLQASFAATNRNGGVFGRALELVVEDSETVRDGRGGVERLVDTGVLALVASAGVDGDAARARIEADGVPVIGPLAPHPASGDTVFALGPGLDRQAEAAIAALSPGAGAIGIIAAKDREGRAWLEGAEREATRSTRVATVVTFEPGRLDAREAAARLRQSGVDVALFAGSAGDLKALLEALGAPAGPGISVVAPAALVGWEAVGTADRTRVPLALTSTVRPTPDGLAFLSETLEKEGISPRHVAIQAHAWASARLLEEALRRAGEDLTAESLVVALESVRGLDTGVLPPIAFGRGRRTGSVEVEVVRVSSGTARARPR